ncbi:MAG: uncharacterized membrane protein YoaK (UPF0700 family) [Ilumatobacter sp.]|jgi:uncharacterized membrane protein YoaK (UPF0700 family)
MADEHINKIGGAPPGRWDPDALWAGGRVCLMLAIPFRVIASIVDSDSSGVNFLFFVLFVSFFVIGAGCAAWVQRVGTPMSHAMVTALGTFAIAEAVFILYRLVVRQSIPWLSIFLAMSFVSVGAIVGGFLGSRLQAQGLRPSSQR